MAWWEILLGIILFIVALGVLIGIHELGHLSAAKMFHVYCFNYSIGFGPKLISSKRTAKHETIWTLRAIPLGGFVSMYGEGAELDSDEYIPPNRSLEGVARYKRAIIISAGVFLNFILGFVLILLHNGCFPRIWFDFPSYLNSNNVYETRMVCSFNDTLHWIGLEDGDELKLQMDPFAGVFLIDDKVSINGQENYVLCMSNIVTTTKTDPLISNSLAIYSRKSLDAVVDDSLKQGYSDKSLVSFILANDLSLKREIVEAQVKEMDKDTKDSRYRTEVTNYYKFRGYDYSVDLTKSYNVNQSSPRIEATINLYHKNAPIHHGRVIVHSNGDNGFKDIGIRLKRNFEWRKAGDVFSTTWNEWCNANTAVFRGLGMLITGQGEVSGIIGIANTSINTLSNFGFERYLFLWGLISCNLAILNLLPFPGLDGWQLVVIAYEAITKKQIPTKVKGIISVIGLGLLFLLMIFIIIKDVIGLIPV